MNEITCPRCKVLQKLSKNKLCSYCFFNLNTETDKLSKINPNLSVDYNNLDNQAIIDILKIDKIKPVLYKFPFFIFIALVFIVSGLVCFYDREIFSIKESELGFIEKSAVFLSLISFYFSYKYFSKNYDLNQSIDSIISDNFRYRDASPFEKKFQFVLFFLVLNFFFVFLNIYAINDISSIVFPSRKFDVFVHQKESKVVKRKYSYYIHVTNWKKDSNETIKLKVPEKQWQMIKQDHPANIKIKRGILNDVIWNLKQ